MMVTVMIKAMMMKTVTMKTIRIVMAMGMRRCMIVMITTPP